LELTKKKKKKKKPFNPDEADGADEVKESKEAVAEEQKEAETAVDGDLDFSLLSKKKKKKKKTVTLDERDGDGDGDEENEPDSETSNAPGEWAQSDRDYTYEELLALVFTTIREKNPDLAAGEKKRLVMRPPQVLRVGTKKSSFANFVEICKQLHRPQKHMQAFLLAELGTSGSVDANNQLIIKGRFVQKQIESVLRRYIKEYVACQTCRSPETILQKETRLFFVQCETCGSRKSVQSIKSGFQAVTGKRAAIRAKGN
jgi:translation initiation factor 2 subunit 2